MQILLISAVISVLAIRFTQTARDQVEIAESFDQRVRAQMAARSAFNEVILSAASSSVMALGGARPPVIHDFSAVNRFGEEVILRNNIVITVQDLNGLLPRLYPRYILWRSLLKQQGVSVEDVDRYLGVWTDLQDTDTESWIEGEEEPSTFNGVGRYPNRLAQTDVLLRSVFVDSPDLSDLILRYSSFYPTPQVNLFNMPSGLLDNILPKELANSIRKVRGDTGLSVSDRQSILPIRYRNESFSLENSSALRIRVSVPMESGNWVESWSVRLAPGRIKPFYEIPN